MMIYGMGHYFDTLFFLWKFNWNFVHKGSKTKVIMGEN